MVPQSVCVTQRARCQVWIVACNPLMLHGSMQETQAGQNEQLAMLKPQDFTTGIAIMSQDGHDYKLKYSRRTVLQLSCHMLSLQY